MELTIELHGLGTERIIEEAIELVHALDRVQFSAAYFRLKLQYSAPEREGISKGVAIKNSTIRKLFALVADS